MEYEREVSASSVKMKRKVNKRFVNTEIRIFTWLFTFPLNDFGFNFGVFFP